MKRWFFFLLAAAAVGGSTYFILFDRAFFVGFVYNFTKIDLSSNAMNGFDLLKNAFEAIKGGTWIWKEFNSYYILIYGMTLALLINIVLIITLVFMLFINLGRFSRVMKFYSVAGWFFFASLVFTGVFGYFLYDTYIVVAMKAKASFMDIVKCIPWQNYVPFGSAIVLGIFGIIFKKSEREF